MLSQSVEQIKGVGEKVKEELITMGIETIEQLLHYFPYRYDLYEIKPLSELVHDDNVTIVGEVVHDPTVSFFGKKKSRLVVMINVDGVAVKGVIFNRAFAKNHLTRGKTVTLIGKWDANRLQITISRYQIGQPKADAEIKPLYTVKGNMTSYRLQKLIKEAVNKYNQFVEEILPEHYLQMYKIPNRQNALKAMHFPENRTQLKHARRRFTYEELLMFQLQMQYLRKMNRETEYGVVQNFNEEDVNQFNRSLPFQLTNAQAKSLQEILNDLQSPLRMNRLLQGDVGSGKTAVAIIALYATVSAGNQGALMVPTEILAEQHLNSIKELVNEKMKIALLTSSVKGKKRETLLEEVLNGQVDIVIGTHALIQDDVHFKQLGLVIIDEQHRFGVEQRRTLRQKGMDPDVLFMTATPIPRTLAITAFGDMDVSIINEMPAGRKEVETYSVGEQMLDRILQFIYQRVQNGEQAYIVSPLIEESETLDYQNAVDLYTQLQTYYGDKIQVGLLHGRLHQDEKDDIMQQFIRNEIQVLVSTTVIEVGVNVPNATVMVVYNAERFGLSQLHQLRGRVGRGDKQSYCILIAEPKGEVGRERMRIMTETTDGFELAEQDLKLRGPGDFFGKKQSGLPDFKVADLAHDYRALEVARQDAVEIIEMNLLETDERYYKLKVFFNDQNTYDMRLD